MIDPIIAKDESADAHGPARKMTRRLLLLLSLFRIGWIAACLLTALSLIILAFVRPPSVEWFAALAGTVVAMPLGWLFLKYVGGQFENQGNVAVPLPVEPAGEALPEPTCCQDPDRFLFSTRVHSPRMLRSEPSRLIFQECGPIRLGIVLLLWGVGILFLVNLPFMWARGVAAPVLVFQLVLGVGLTVGCSSIFLRLRIALDRDTRTATFRWGLLFPVRTEVKSLTAFDTAVICNTAGPHSKSGRSREYVVRLGNSMNREDFLDLLQVWSREHAERLAGELRDFLGLIAAEGS